MSQGLPVVIERVCNDFDVRSGGEVYRLVILLPNGQLIEPTIVKEEFDAVILAVGLHKASLGEDLREEAPRPQKVAAIARRQDLVRAVVPPTVFEEEPQEEEDAPKVFGGDFAEPVVPKAGKIISVSADEQGNPIVHREGAMDHTEILGHGAVDEDGAPSI